MQNRLSPNARLPPYIYWETVFAYDAGEQVSTLTPLLAFTDLGSDFSALAIFLNNTDTTNTVQLIVEFSHGGTNVLESATQTKTIVASREDYVEISPPNPLTYVRISAQTLSPFPTVNVQWSIIGLRR